MLPMVYNLEVPLASGKLVVKSPTSKYEVDAITPLTNRFFFRYYYWNRSLIFWNTTRCNIKEQRHKNKLQKYLVDLIVKIVKKHFLKELSDFFYYSYEGVLINIRPNLNR